MTELMAKRVRLLLKKYRQARVKDKQEKIRDLLFAVVREFMMGCMQHACKKHRRYETEQALLSMVWDCFYAALQSMDYKKVDVFSPEYFFRNQCAAYVRRMLDREREQRKKARFTDLSAVDSYYHSMPGEMIDSVMVLDGFYKYIPQEYRKPFEDALRGMNGGMSNTDYGVLTKIRYYESRKCFRWIIEYMMRDCTSKHP